MKNENNKIEVYKTDKTIKLTEKEEKEYEKIRKELIAQKVNDESISLKEQEIKQFIQNKVKNTENIYNRLNNDLKGYPRGRISGAVYRCVTSEHTLLVLHL